MKVITKIAISIYSGLFCRFSLCL